MPHRAGQGQQEEDQGQYDETRRSGHQSVAHGRHRHAQGQHQPPAPAEDVRHEAGGNVGDAAADNQDGVQEPELEDGKAHRRLDYRQEDDDALAVPVGEAVADGQVREDEGAAAPVMGLAAKTACRISCQ